MKRAREEYAGSAYGDEYPPPPLPPSLPPRRTPPPYYDDARYGHARGADAAREREREYLDGRERYGYEPRREGGARLPPPPPPPARSPPPYRPGYERDERRYGISPR